MGRDKNTSSLRTNKKADDKKKAPKRTTRVQTSLTDVVAARQRVETTNRRLERALAKEAKREKGKPTAEVPEKGSGTDLKEETPSEPPKTLMSEQFLVEEILGGLNSAHVDKSPSPKKPRSVSIPDRNAPTSLQNEPIETITLKKTEEPSKKSSPKKRKKKILRSLPLPPAPTPEPAPVVTPAPAPMPAIVLSRRKSQGVKQQQTGIKKLLPTSRTKLHVGLPSQTQILLPQPFHILVPEAPMIVDSTSESESAQDTSMQEEESGKEGASKRKREDDGGDSHSRKRFKSNGEREKSTRKKKSKEIFDNSKDSKHKKEKEITGSEALVPPQPEEPRSKRVIHTKKRDSPLKESKRKPHQTGSGHPTPIMTEQMLRVQIFEEQLKAINYSLDSLDLLSIRLLEKTNFDETMNESYDTDQISDWSDSAVESSDSEDEIIKSYLNGWKTDGHNNHTEQDEQQFQDQIEIDYQESGDEIIIESPVQSSIVIPPEKETILVLPPSPPKEKPPSSPEENNEYTALKISARRYNPMRRVDEFFTEWYDGTFTWEPHESFVDDKGTKTQCYIDFLNSEKKDKPLNSSQPNQQTPEQTQLAPQHTETDHLTEIAITQ